MTRSSMEDASYPYASAPDIVRSNQKDAYFSSRLHEDLAGIARSIYGSRFVHRYDAETRTFSDFLYLCLTTLIGNRTLGEEYCDVHQVDSKTRALPSIAERTCYILSAVILPYGLGRALPILKATLSQNLKRRLVRLRKEGSAYRLHIYLLAILSEPVSLAPVYAMSLALFYVSGSYYHLSKRLVGLRYIFSRQVAPSEQRSGYELLGLLLGLQLIIQTYMHARSFLLPDVADSAAVTQHITEKTDQIGANKGKSRNITNTNTDLMPSSTARYDLSETSNLGWIQPQQQRKCTLCLEAMKDPSVTTCGHVFCWTCIQEWQHEKPECPLCRQAILAQHILPLRG